MAKKTIAHLSDLHIGRSARQSLAAVALRDAVVAANIDCVIVTGDVTDHGRSHELAEFETIFEPLRLQGRLVMIPGNHDCLGDHAASRMMSGPRVDLVKFEGLSIIRINSTSWHNLINFAGHGTIKHGMIEQIDELIARVPPSDLIVVALHHHLLPLPEEKFIERVAEWFRLPFASELKLGEKLLNGLKGRCNLVLHGHRHVPSEMVLPGGKRELRVYNAGSSTSLKAFRVFTYENSILIGAPTWMRAPVPQTSPFPKWWPFAG